MPRGPLKTTLLLDGGPPPPPFPFSLLQTIPPAILPCLFHTRTHTLTATHTQPAYLQPIINTTPLHSLPSSSLPPSSVCTLHHFHRIWSAPSFTSEILFFFLLLLQTISCSKTCTTDMYIFMVYCYEAEAESL